jgi:uroporphyrinogen-III decarboxylase
MKKMTSRERVLNALSLKEVDYIPSTFMSFTALRNRFNEDTFKLCEAELEMGLDPMLFLRTPRSQRKEHPDLRGFPIRFHPEVKTREWREEIKGDYDILHKEYITPAGTLSTSVRLSEDWPHGEHIPFIDDYQVPRAIKPLVTSEDDLAPLSYMLQPPHKEDITKYNSMAAKAKDFSDENEVILAGGWGVGLDMTDWLCGMENVMIFMMENPEFLSKLLKMIHEWNMQRMEVMLNTGIELFVRRAWYEGCEFVVPSFYEKELVPLIKKEVGLAHNHGVKFGYNCSSGIMPLLELHKQTGLDVLIGIDPVQGTGTDMKELKKKMKGSVCLWGGVSGAVTVERGNETEIREAVREAMQTLGPEGFVLCPVDNITVDAPLTWTNLKVFIDEWQKMR